MSDDKAATPESPGGEREETGEAVVPLHDQGDRIDDREASIDYARLDEEIASARARAERARQRLEQLRGEEAHKGAEDVGKGA